MNACMYEWELERYGYVAAGRTRKQGPEPADQVRAEYGAAHAWRTAVFHRTRRSRRSL